MIDSISGNSTGAIIALALVTPNKDNNGAKFTAQDIVEFYKSKSKEIFHHSLWWKIKTAYGLFGPKYDRTNLDCILAKYFEDRSLSEVLKPVFVFSYSLDLCRGHVWNSRSVGDEPARDFYLRYITAATTAAPTYFAPVKLNNILNKY